MVPTIFDADRKSLGEIARETRALAEKVRDGKITPPELSGGTFTVSNLGMYGIDRITPGDQPAAGGDPRRRRDEPAARRRRRRGDRAHAHGAHARLRPPDPLRRRRRGVPLRASASGSRTRSASRSSRESRVTRPEAEQSPLEVSGVGAVELRVGRRGGLGERAQALAARARGRRPGRCRRRPRTARRGVRAGSGCAGRSGFDGRGERDEPVGEVREVPGARAGGGGLEVDRADRQPVAEREVVGREVVVADHLGRLARRERPACAPPASKPAVASWSSRSIRAARSSTAGAQTQSGIG